MNTPTRRRGTTRPTARALWLDPPNHAHLEDETLDERGPEQLLLRNLYSAISRGTETLTYLGAIPESEYERMRAPFQSGTLPGSVKHGYASVGVVEDGPPEWVGRSVFCLHPHQTRYIVPAQAVVPVPEHVPENRAVLAANMETAVNALWDAAPRIGDRISVVGAGVVGCLVAHLCAKLPGTRVELIDIIPGRKHVATTLGVDFSLPECARTNRDLVFNTSTSSTGLDKALTLAGKEAEVIEMSWYGSRATTVNLGGSFHAQRLSLRASQVGTVAPARAARWSHSRRLALAVELCSDPRLDVLFEPDIPFDTLPEVMARLASPDDQTLCQRVIYPKETECTT